MSHKTIKGQLVCVALNDKAHIAAMQSAFNEAPHKQPPTQPVLYFKPRNTFNVDGGVIDWPVVDRSGHSERFVVGASVGLVINKTCCRVSAATALDYIAGYALVHDFSLPEKSYYRPDIKGKCLDGTAPVSDTVIVKSDVKNLSELSVTTAVNGVTVSTLPLANLERDAFELISIISHIMTLQPGDVIAMGFAAQRSGVQAGDRVVSKLADVLSLENTVGGAQ
ncbi:MAG: fumarylacetoacetate hydrolase family protein [Psychrosphaera sp.]|nr:fumarylacetoacetate hydrolase family protein [Psychrosphaera sp.]